MTSTAPQPASVYIEAAPGWALRLAWDLSAKAGRGLAERLGREGARVASVELALDPGESAREAAAVLMAELDSGERVEMRRVEGTSALWRREAAYEHVDVPGVVSYSARRDARHAPTFVRCPWLAECGVPAGSYSLSAARG